MTYRSIFVFDNNSHWYTDWSQQDFADERGRRLGFFTRMDHAYDGRGPANHWIGRDNTLSVVRDEGDQLVDLYSMINDAPYGGHDGLLTGILRKQADDASHRLPPLVNVYYRPEVIRFSCTYGQRAVGPGGMHGGLRTVPERFAESPLLTLKVPLHINTPPGMSSIDAELVFYFALHVADGHVAADVIGGAHPWRFHGDGYGAYQNEINQGLSAAVESALPQLGIVNQLLTQYRARDAYLVPGAAAPKLEDDKPLQGQAVTRMTLAIQR